MRNTYRILVMKAEGKRPLERPTEMISSSSSSSSNSSSKNVFLMYTMLRRFNCLSLGSGDGLQ
jgi:hypothetical protein